MGGSVHPDEFSYRRISRKQTRNYPMSIPLRSLSSKSTSASTPAQNENPFETASIISANASLLSHASESTITAAPRFLPTTKLQVQTPGHGVWALPFAINNMETVIFTLDGNNKCERPKWISIRPERGKGHFYVSDAEDEMQTSLAMTTFMFGPGKDPVVRIGRNESDREIFGGEVEEFEMKTRWTTRTTTFVWNGRTYQWKYGSRAERQAVMSEIGEDCHDLLVLEEVVGPEQKVRRKNRVLARFIRGEKSRTPGTKPSAAGNGGRLEMAIEGNLFASVPDVAAGSQELAGTATEWEIHETRAINELAVITTLLVMLKKEIDRMRAWQIAAICKLPSPFHSTHHLSLSLTWDYVEHFGTNTLFCSELTWNCAHSIRHCLCCWMQN